MSHDLSPCTAPEYDPDGVVGHRWKGFRRWYDVDDDVLARSKGLRPDATEMRRPDPEDIRKEPEAWLESLRAHLQMGLVIELFTLPPYLSALWSIPEGANRDSALLIRGVLMEEMLHMGLVSNVLNAVGGTPVIASDKVIQQYPSRIPYSGLTLEVPLAPFSEDAICGLRAIETPEELAPDNPPWLTAYGFASIGEFYAVVLDMLWTLTLVLGPTAVFTGKDSRQLYPRHYYGGGGDLIVVPSTRKATALGEYVALDDAGSRQREVLAACPSLRRALFAIHTIVAQGEGGRGVVVDLSFFKEEASPAWKGAPKPPLRSVMAQRPRQVDCLPVGDGDTAFGQAFEPAHFYKFDQILKGQYYKDDSDCGLKPTGKMFEVDWDDVHQFIENPVVSDYAKWPEVAAMMSDFNTAFTRMLRQLEQAMTGEQDQMIEAVRTMHGLGHLGRSLMRLESPRDPTRTVGCPFQLTPKPPGVPDKVRELAESLGIDLVFPVPEGGWFLPTFKSERGAWVPPLDDLGQDQLGSNSDTTGRVPAAGGYYVLLKGELGALHQLKCAELYTFVDGDPLEMMILGPGDALEKLVLGPAGVQSRFIPGRAIHGVRPKKSNHGYSICHLVTIPAFDFADALVPTRAQLVANYPVHAKQIVQFTRESAPPPHQPAPPHLYMDPIAKGVRIIPLLTVGDQRAAYRFVGQPDGIGVYRDHEGNVQVLLTHELFFHQGRVRRHGAMGAFVSEWTLDDKHNVVSGRDLIEHQEYWSFASQRLKRGKALPFERLCSADLPPLSATRFEEDGVVFGTAERILLGGEETHTKYRPDCGRALAHVISGEERGVTYELPHLGRISFENVVLCPHNQRKTVAALPDDANNDTGPHYEKRAHPSELYIYVGVKRSEGNTVQRAGLWGGQLFGVRLRNSSGVVRREGRDLGFGHSAYSATARFELVEMPDSSADDRWDEPGVALQKASLARGITQFLRLEDVAWDPRLEHDGDLYVVTTDEFDGNSRLLRLRFDDIEAPLAGGEIEILLEGRTAWGHRFQMLDSITVDRWGRVFVQEDSGSAVQRSRTWMYDIATGSMTLVAIASYALFHPDGSAFLTQNEESSGIIPAFDELGDGWYLSNVQAHRALPAELFDGASEDERERLERELVEGGQLLAIYIPQALSSSPKEA